MPTITTRAARQTAMAVLALTLGLSLTACGNGDDDKAGDANRSSANGSANRTADSGGDGATADPGTTASINKSGLVAQPVVVDANGAPLFRLGERSDPVPGLVTVDGSLDALTGKTREAYKTYADRSATIGVGASGETRAFQRLCVGDIDIVDSSRPITPAEWAACQSQGLDIVQFQVAADAIVLAIKSETDVGEYCLSTDQANEIFTAGSKINKWSQVGPQFDDIALATGGPSIESNAFQFFGRYVLNSPEPSITNFRNDYQARRDEDATRLFVVGSDTDQLRTRNLARVAPRRQALLKQLRQARAIRAGARDELVVALAERTKGFRTGRSAADQAADEARVQAAYVARSEAIDNINLIKAKYKPVDARYQVAAAAQRRIDATNGHVGLFSESYYSVYENLLKPFEIEVSDGDNQRDCIFPSPQTIVNGQYPLSRQLLLTTTTRALKRPEVRNFLQFYLRNSQILAVNSNVIPLPNKDVQTQLDWLDPGPLPRFASVDGGPVEIVTTTDEAANPNTTATAPVEKPAR